jgi:hypothetical protein
MNYATLSKHLLAVLISWFCPAFWWRGSNIHLLSPSLLLDQPLYQKKNGKVVPLSNKAPRHEYAWRNGSIAPWILSFSIIRKWVLSFTPTPPQSFYATGKSPRYTSDRHQVSPRVGLDAVERGKKMSYLHRQSKTDPSIPQSVACSLYSMSYPGSKQNRQDRNTYERDRKR